MTAAIAKILAALPDEDIFLVWQPFKLTPFLPPILLWN
jgi:hypothetical protein